MPFDTNFKPICQTGAASVTGGNARVTGRRKQQLVSIRLQRELIAWAYRGVPTTYGRLHQSMGAAADVDAALVKAALKRLMDEDAIADRPFVAALAISPQAGGLPEPWFFSKARTCGRMASRSDELEAWAYHARELQRAISFYRAMPSHAAPAHRKQKPGAVNTGANDMMMAKDIMTPDVITVASDVPVRSVAEILVTEGISGVPVLDDGILVGIVTEGDLLHRAEIGTETRPVSWWTSLFKGKAQLAAVYSREHSTRVGDVMTKDVVTVDETTPISDIADLLERNSIRRVPVMRGAQVVGIVSRSSIIRALAVAASPVQTADAPSDETIRQQILTALHEEAWPSASATNLKVEHGVVSFWGTVESDEQRKALRILCENVAGVRSVDDSRVILDFPIIAT